MGSTSRLNLNLPGGGSSGAYTPDEVADIDTLNQNFAVLDGAVGLPAVTSATRPGSPFDGQMIQETDTKDVYFWSATLGQWRQQFPHVGTTPPATPQEGYLWVDTT